MVWTNTGRALSRSRWNLPSRRRGLPIETLKTSRPHDRRSRERLHSLGHGRHATHHGLGHVDRHLESAAGHRQLHAAGNRAPIHCAGTTTCRARATTGPCRTCFPATNRWMIPRCGRVSKPVGRSSCPSTKGLDNHQMVEAIHQGKLKAMYLIGEEMSTRRFQRELCRRCLRQARVLCRAGHLLQRHLPVCRRRVAGQSQPGKGRHVYQHRTAHPEALSGVRAVEGSRPDWKIIQDVANHLGAGWHYKHPSEIIERLLR